MRRLPTLRGLQAFEAVSRAGNLADAAEMIGVTPSAVSHRLRGLEEELGIRLFAREAKGLALTEAGRRYRVGVQEAFDLLDKATDDLVGPDMSRPLTVSLTNDFGMRWLMPRFHRFRAKHPDIDVALLSTDRLVDIAAGEADLGLRYGMAPWPGLHHETMLPFVISPLCAPGLMEKIEGLSAAEAIAEFTVIREVNDDWDVWLEAAGISDIKPGGQLWFADCTMGIAAAIEGQGIALGYFGYVESEIASGTLVQPFDLTVDIPKAYHLVYPEGPLTDPRARAFRNWVIEESKRPGPPRETTSPAFQVSNPAGIIDQ